VNRASKIHFGLPWPRLPKPAARWTRLFALGALVGVLGGLMAAGLESGLHYGSEVLAGRYTHLGSAEVLHFNWGVLLLPAVGGLAAGVAVRLLCPESRGHGTDVLTRAFHHNLGRLALKGPAIKGVAAVGVISCGGSAGPEGPIAAFGAGIGSAIGRVFGVTARERRILLVAGCAAGVGAIFQCPLGGALFAASVLYREPEFEAEAIVPSFVASVLGYSAFISFWGSGNPLLPGTENLRFESAAELLPYALLGPLCGAVSIFFAVCVRGVERRLVPWSRLPGWLAPAAGGLATGGLACVLPQVMDGRYLFIQNAVGLKQTFFASGAETNWWWWTGLFAAVILAKCVATGFTVGSGASGGLLGPSVFIGGVVGAFLGALLEALSPGGMFPESLREALIPVGMGGVLAAAMRTPLAAIVMVTEMTGSYGLIVPLMLVCVSAYVVGRRWGLNHEQVPTTAESPAHASDAVVHMLESWRVEELIDREWAETVPPHASLGEMVTLIRPGTQPVFAVVEEDRLLGLISVPDIRRIMQEPGLADAVIALDIMSERPGAVHPGQDVYSALSELERQHRDVAPVVPADGTQRWLGMLTRQRVFERVQREIAEMQKLVLREHTGLAAIEQEGQLQHLVMGVTPAPKDVIQRLLVPLQAVGQSLREADVRRAFGIQVIAIEQPDGSLQCPPDVDAPLQSSQRLVAIVARSEGPAKK